MRRSSYQIVSFEGNIVTLRDINGSVSVTNDAENVVREVVEWKGKFTESGEPLRIFYYDSMENLDELCHKNGIFTHFAPVDKVRKS